MSEQNNVENIHTTERRVRDLLKKCPEVNNRDYDIVRGAKEPGEIIVAVCNEPLESKFADAKTGAKGYSERLRFKIISADPDQTEKNSYQKFGDYYDENPKYTDLVFRIVDPATVEELRQINSEINLDSDPEVKSFLSGASNLMTLTSEKNSEEL